MNSVQKVDVGVDGVDEVPAVRAAAFVVCSHGTMPPATGAWNVDGPPWTGTSWIPATAMAAWKAPTPPEAGPPVCYRLRFIFRVHAQSRTHAMAATRTMATTPMCCIPWRIVTPTWGTEARCGWRKPRRSVQTLPNGVLIAGLGAAFGTKRKPMAQPGDHRGQHRARRKGAHFVSGTLLLEKITKASPANLMGAIRTVDMTILGT